MASQNTVDNDDNGFDFPTECARRGIDPKQFYHIGTGIAYPGVDGTLSPPVDNAFALDWFAEHRNSPA